MAGRLSSPQFIGRRTELDRLASAVAAAAEGRPSVVLVAGEAGVGKSRLVAEASAAARAAGMLVLEGGAVDLGDTPLPFGPIVEALRDLLRQLGPSGVADVADDVTREALGYLVPDITDRPSGSPSAVLSSEWQQARTFEAVLSLLTRLSEREPVMVVAEDVHWADRSTRDVLAFLVRNVRRERLLVLATFRSDELHRKHPLVPWVAELQRLENVERLDLEPFDRAEQAAQLTSILGSPPSADLLDLVHGRSDGNAYFAEELLGFTASGSGSNERRPLPTSLADLLLARAATLSEAAQHILGVASVAGRSVQYDLLLAVADTSETDLEAALREATSRHFLVAEHDPVARYDFRHALAREAVYEDLLPSERRRLHERYATALAERPTPPGAAGAHHLGELAHHWTAAHVRPRALAASIAAADAAGATFAFAEAAGHYERAIELWDLVEQGDRPDHIDDVELCDRAANAFLLIGEGRRGVDFEEDAVRRLGRSLDLERAADLRMKLGRLQGHVGDGNAAVNTMAEALSLLPDGAPSPRRAAVLVGVATAYFFSGEVRRAVDVATSAIETAIAVGARATEGHARNIKGVALSFLGECAAAIALLEEAVAIAHEVEGPRDIGIAYANLSGALFHCGRRDRAIEVTRAGAEAARTLGIWRSYGVVFQTGLAALLVETGEWDEAHGILNDLSRNLAEDGELMEHFAVVTARLAVRRGDADIARLVGRTRENIHRSPDVEYTAAAFQTQIEAELFARRPDAATEAARDGMARVRRPDDLVNDSLLGLIAFATAAEAERASVARAKGDALALDAARQTAGEYRQRLEVLARDRSSDDGDVIRYATWADAEYSRVDGPDPDAWGDVRAAWTDVRRPYFAAYAGFRQAEAALEAHRPKAEAAVVLRDSHAIAVRLGARPLLAWIESLAARARIDVAVAPETAAAPHEKALDERRRTSDIALDRFGLTSREREILALLAAGWTNKRIAASLFISENTAGVHVSNILGKLGVTNRVEAATLAARLGVEPQADSEAATLGSS